MSLFGFGFIRHDRKKLESFEKEILERREKERKKRGEGNGRKL